MEKVKILICLFAFSIILTGCEKAPSEVKEEIDNYHNAQTVQEAKIITLSISEALKDAYNFCSENSTNIFIQNLILPDCNQMPIYNARFNTTGTADLFTQLQYEPLFANNGNGTTVNTPNNIELWKSKPNYCYTAFPELDGKNFYRNETDIQQADWGTYFGQNMRMTDSGCLTLYADEFNTGIGSAFNYSVEKRFLNNFNSNCETYELCDGSKMSVSDATQFAQKFCNKYLAKNENDYFEYQVNYVDVRNIDLEKYGFYISICRKDSYGNFFDATPIYLYTYDEFESRNALIAPHIYLWITTSNTISEFEMNYTFSLEEQEVIEKIVTLESAVNTLSQVLAQGKSYNFDTVELKYIFEVTQSDYIDDARKYAKSSDYDGTMYGVVYSPDSIYAYGDYHINVVPYWVFTDIKAQNADTNCGNIFMINAIDGNLRIENADGSGNQIIHY